MVPHPRRMLRRRLLPLLLALAGGCARPATRPAPAPARSAAERPALVVMVVVDQLREPLLERYDDLFTGGLRRLLDQGRFYTRASHDHAATKTAVGHAALVTGVHPHRHGVIGNEWEVRTPAGWKTVSNVADSTVKVVGFPAFPGVSPHHQMRSGLADWLVAARPEAIVASVSGKDRGAVQPASHAKGHVYWFDPRAGRFVTSTYYRDAYPAWVERFTAEVLPRYAADSVWESTVPAAALGRSRPDTLASEGNGRDTFFPHAFVKEGRPERGPRQFWIWLDRTPMLDALTLDFAKATVSALGMGRDATPDLLNVSVSQTDRVGHEYGPLSREELDNLLRLDRALGDFFAHLDATVGAGRWTAALSADHGSPVAPEDLPVAGEAYTGHRMTPAEAATMDSIRARADRNAADPATPAWVVAELKKLPIVVDAWTHASLERGQLPDSFAVLARRSIYPGRAGGEFSRQGVEVRFVPGYMERPRGVDHGAPYWYDRHVPMIFMGPGIAPGRDPSRASTVDFGPTLARLLGVPAPRDLDGKALPGVVGR